MALRMDGPALRTRRMPLGADALATGGVEFRVWAPSCTGVTVCIEHAPGGSSAVPLVGEERGYFAGFSAAAAPGDLYRLKPQDRTELLPDPASRFQPDGPLGPSMVIDPAAFPWTDHTWPGIGLPGQVIYELHIGTFTPQGTWQAARAQLPRLRELGVTVLEVMPVHDFCGRFGWGYDGVAFFAPTRLYGTPDDFRAFVDRAHALGIGVILDVVYNHAGPVGNVLKQFSSRYFTDHHHTDWGEAFDFEGPESVPVREFFITNAAYWIREFHLDGLRLDATQNIYDSSATHILAEIVSNARAAADGRTILMVAENEPQELLLTRPREEGGHGMDAIWNDDFHHTAVVALTGHNEAYYSDYGGTAQELVSAFKWGFLYQGQYYRWQRKRRGSPSKGCAPMIFINYLENHDQVANLGGGHHLHELCHPGELRAMTALLLLSPQTPLLFQGQEFASTRRFTYFADHHDDLAAAVRAGRLEFLSQFPSLATAEARARLPDPGDPGVFEACRLDPSERDRHAEAYALHRDLLRLRREDAVFRAQGTGGIDGAVLGPRLLAVRYFAADDGRLLIVNLDSDTRYGPAPEPLLAPPPGRQWELLWSSEDPRYGGTGTEPRETIDGWFVPGKAAFAFGAVTE